MGLDLDLQTLKLSHQIVYRLIIRSRCVLLQKVSFQGVILIPLALDLILTCTQRRPWPLGAASTMRNDVIGELMAC